MGFEAVFEQRKQADVTDVRWESLAELRSRATESSAPQTGWRQSKVDGGRGSEGAGWGGDIENSQIWEDKVMDGLECMQEDFEVG